jgi:hypothetical protein
MLAGFFDGKGRGGANCAPACSDDVVRIGYANGSAARRFWGGGERAGGHGEPYLFIVGLDRCCCGVTSIGWVLATHPWVPADGISAAGAAVGYACMHSYEYQSGRRRVGCSVHQGTCYVWCTRRMYDQLACCAGLCVSCSKLNASAGAGCSNSFNCYRTRL